MCYPGPEVIQHVLCSTQLNKKFVLLINLKLLTIANSFLLNIAEHKIFSVDKYDYANYFGIFIFISREISRSAELSMKNVLLLRGFSGLISLLRRDLL